MKKKLHALDALLLFGLISISANINADYGNRKKTVAKETPAMQVSREISTLDQIVAQAQVIVKASGDNVHKTRANAKSQIKKLMKELEPKVKDAIKEHIEVILGATAKNTIQVRNAYDKLIATVNVINAQGDVISVMEEGKQAIEQAPAHMKEQVIAEVVNNVQAAEEKAEEVGMMARVVGGIKSAIAAPGNYIFGEERTATKTAVEAVVGTIITTGAAYLTYKYLPEETRAQLGEYYSKAREALSFGKKTETGQPTTEKPETYSLGKASKKFGKTILTAPVQEPDQFEPGLPEELTTPESRTALHQAIKNAPKNIKESVKNTFASKEEEMSDYAKYTTGNMTPEEELDYLSAMQRDAEWNAAGAPEKSMLEKAQDMFGRKMDQLTEHLDKRYVEKAEAAGPKSPTTSAPLPPTNEAPVKYSSPVMDLKSPEEIQETQTLLNAGKKELRSLLEQQKQLIRENKQNTPEFQKLKEKERLQRDLNKRRADELRKAKA